MILGGTLWASRGAIKESLPSMGEWVGKIYEATNFPNTPDIGDIGGALRAAGQVNLGTESGLGYDYDIKPVDIKPVGMTGEGSGLGGVEQLSLPETTTLRSGQLKVLGSNEPLMLRGTQTGDRISFGSEHPIFGELLGGRSGTVEYMGNPFLEEGGKLIPDVSKDTTRLYRGETATGEIKQISDWLSSQPEVKATREATGRWFTNNLSDAEWYALEGLGKISYVDVPNKVADLYRVDNLGSGVSDFTSTGKELTEFFLPRSIAESKQPLTNIGRTPTSEEVSYYTGKYGTTPMQLKGEKTAKWRGIDLAIEKSWASSEYIGERNIPSINPVYRGTNYNEFVGKMGCKEY